jgi:tetratricopeptide (TPR) repeat protein
LPLPDPRSFEGQMRRAVRQLTGEDDSSPLARAEDIMDQAFAEPNEQRRLALARQALAVCPDCADAYVLLAENAPSRQQSLALYEQALAAGERAIGPDAFREHAGHFWGVLQTRPYMRARLGLALRLWELGRRDEAVAHLEDMLRLNPNDNQGVRFTLAGFLLFLDRDNDLEQLIERYPDGSSAAWNYTLALLAFRRAGDTAEARELLRHAIVANPHVPDYLLGRKFPPYEGPGGYVHGEESEALVYIASFMAGWRDTSGAITWLRANDEKTRQRQAQIPRPRGPLGFIKAWLKKNLAQQHDVWQADARQLPNPIRIGEDKVRPWLVLVVSQTNGLVLGHAIREDEPDSAALWDALLQAMQNPVAGEPHRPTELQVPADEHWTALRPHFEEIGVQMVSGEDQIEEFEDAFGSLLEHMAGNPRPGLLEVPGIRPEQVAGYYAAAADFFRRRPWKKVGYESAIKIECDRFHSGPWYGVLMGQSGLARGLAVYEDLQTLIGLWQEPGTDEDNARRSVGTSVIFCEEVDMPLADVEAAKRYGWAVAGPDAYPDVMHKEQGHSFRRPLAWELELLESCLRAIPDFLARRKQDDPTPEEFTVAVASGDLKLVLSWVPPEAEG